MSKKGFTFYSSDTDRFSDPRIRRLKRSRLGATAYVVYEFVLNEVYRQNGYYLPLDDDCILNTAEYWSVSEADVQEILNYCLDIGLFDRQMFDTHKVLTSRSIQRRYLEICRRSNRTPKIADCYLLLTEDNADEADNAGGTADNSRKNAEKSEEGTEKSEETPKKSKEKAKSCEEAPTTTGDSPSERQKATAAKGGKGQNVGEKADLSQQNAEKSEERGKKSECATQNKIKENKYSLSISPSFLPKAADAVSEREKENFLRFLFFERNVKNPTAEAERFANHYEKVGWVDSNGNAIRSRIAALRNWNVPDSVPRMNTETWMRWKELLRATKSLPDGIIGSVSDAQEIGASFYVTLRAPDQDAAGRMVEALDKALPADVYHRLFGNKPLEYRVQITN